jgi:hypothetical protein
VRKNDGKNGERINNTKQSASDMEPLLRKVHTKKLKNNGKIAVSMCLQLLWNRSMEEYHGRNDYEPVGIMRDIFWVRYIYLDKIRVIDREIEYYYGKTIEKIIKWKDTSRKNYWTIRQNWRKNYEKNSGEIGMEGK